MNTTLPRFAARAWANQLAGVVLVAAVAAPAGAAPGDVSRSSDGAHVLHARVPARGDLGSAVDGEGGRPGPPVFVYDPINGGALPSEMQRDGQSLPRPDVPPEARDNEAIHSPQGFTSDGLAAPSMMPNPSAGGPGERPPGDGDAASMMDPRQTLGDVAHPDRSTGRERTLNYRTVFDPSVLPFKRNRALDRVADDETLRVDKRGIRPIAIAGNSLPSGREPFWGTIVIRAAAGERVPLPSVSPDSRILSYQATPPVELLFEKDRADNFYVTAKASGQYRVVFVMDAATSYFARPIPTGFRSSDVPADLKPKLPAGLQRSAREVARLLGLGPRDDYARIVHRLVKYFREFEPGEPPPVRGSVYADLCIAKVGVCRHRGYAFVVTAHGLGIPARYVFNEAHVFVEVWVPGARAGWVRIDLGGGADELNVHGGDDKTLHRVQGRDPFEQPESYARSVGNGEAAGATRVQGLPSASREPASGEPTAAGGLPEPTTSGELGAPPAHPAERSSAGAARAMQEAVQRMPGPARQVAPDAVATRTTLAIDQSLVFRGDTLMASGAVVANGRAVTSGMVKLLLISPDGQVALLETAEIAPDGTYRQRLRVPPTQAPSGYEIIAEFTGDAKLAPSRSE